MTVLSPTAPTTTSHPDIMPDDVMGSMQEIEMANKSSNNVEIRKSGAFGWGVFAKTAIPKGTVVFTGRLLAISDKQNTHTIQTTLDEHVLMDLPARYSNHMCASDNLGLRIPSDENHYLKGGDAVYDFVAKRDILPSEELAWDYETTEVKIKNFPSCKCGSSKCRGQVLGFREHWKQVIEDHGREWVAPFLLDAITDMECD